MFQEQSIERRRLREQDSGFAQFGWIRSEENETLVAVMVAGVQVIPDEVSRVLACSCKAAEQ